MNQNKLQITLKQTRRAALVLLIAVVILIGIITITSFFSGKKDESKPISSNPSSLPTPDTNPLIPQASVFQSTTTNVKFDFGPNATISLPNEYHDLSILVSQGQYQDDLIASRMTENKALEYVRIHKYKNGTNTNNKEILFTELTKVGVDPTTTTLKGESLLGINTLSSYYRSLQQEYYVVISAFSLEETAYLITISRQIKENDTRNSLTQSLTEVRNSLLQRMPVAATISSSNIPTDQIQRDQANASFIQEYQ